MPLHHGEAAQEVSALGAKVWEFPGQDGEPATDGTMQLWKTAAEKQMQLSLQATHLRAPSGSAWSPPSPARWGASSDDSSTGLLSPSSTSSPSGQREALHLWLFLFSVSSSLGRLGPLTQSPAVHSVHPGAEGLRPAPHQLLQGLSEAALQGAEGGAGGGAALRHRQGVGVALVLQLQAGSDVEQLLLVVLQPSRTAP